MWLPQVQNCRLEFLKAILKGDKLFLRIKDVKHIDIPKTRDLSVKALEPHYIKNPLI